MNSQVQRVWVAVATKKASTIPFTLPSSIRHSHQYTTESQHTQNKQNNIECGIHYQPNHLLSLYKTIYSLPVSEKLFTELLTLPLHVDLSLANINRICKIITEFMSIKNA